MVLGQFKDFGIYCLGNAGISRTRRPKRLPCLVSGDIECRIYIKKDCIEYIRYFVIDGDALIKGLSNNVR